MDVNDYLTPTYVKAYEAHIQEYGTAIDQLLSIAQFNDYMKKAGVKDALLPKYRKLSFKTEYKSFLQDKCKAQSKILIALARHYRIFDVFKASKFSVRAENKDNVSTVFVDFGLQPLRNRDSMFQCMYKLDGLLYRGEIPAKLQEKWRPKFGNKIAPKSALPDFATTCKMGVLSFFAVENNLFARMAKDYLVLRFVFKVEFDPNDGKTEVERNKALFSIIKTNIKLRS